MKLGRLAAGLMILAGLTVACASEGTPAFAPATTSPSSESSGGQATPPSGGTTPATAPPRTIIVGGTDAVPGDRGPRTGTGNPGDAATRMLRPSGAARLVVAVHTQDGAEPPQQALDHVRSVLASVSGKSVTVVDGGTPGARSTWTADNLRAAASGGARAAAPDEAVLHLLFLHGSSDRGDDTLGLSVASDVAAVFPDRVRDAAGGLTPPSALMDAVTMHETGHLLGLVDLVLHTGRADPKHPGHSTNPGSVMYWAVESSLITDLLTGGPPREFDDRDRADLATIRRG